MRENHVGTHPARSWTGTRARACAGRCCTPGLRRVRAGRSRRAGCRRWNIVIGRAACARPDAPVLEENGLAPADGDARPDHPSRPEREEREHGEEEDAERERDEIRNRELGIGPRDVEQVIPRREQHACERRRRLLLISCPLLSSVAVHAHSRVPGRGINRSLLICTRDVAGRYAHRPGPFYIVVLEAWVTLGSFERTLHLQSTSSAVLHQLVDRLD